MVCNEYFMDSNLNDEVGDVQNFYYTDLIKAAFESGDIAQLQNLDDKVVAQVSISRRTFDHSPPGLDRQ